MIINKENSIHEMRSGQIVKYCVKQIVRANEAVKVWQIGSLIPCWWLKVNVYLLQLQMDDQLR